MENITKLKNSLKTAWGKATAKDGRVMKTLASSRTALNKAGKKLAKAGTVAGQSSAMTATVLWEIVAHPFENSQIFRDPATNKIAVLRTPYKPSR